MREKYIIQAENESKGNESESRIPHCGFHLTERPKF